tara:strand:- start:107 stop:625 length:519 start_codon:yes stop_codon:yes gene_type:complete
MIVTLKNIEIQEANKISKWKSDPVLSKIIMSSFAETNVKKAERWIKKCNEDNEQILKGIYCKNDKALKFVGISRLMFIDYTDLTAELGIYIGEYENQNIGVGKKAIQLTLDIGFNMLKLNKIYLRVLEDNNKAVNSFLKNNFKIEGCLKEHYKSNEIFKNVIYMAIFKENFK